MVRLSLAFVLIGSLGCIVVQSGDEDEDLMMLIMMMMNPLANL